MNGFYLSELLNHINYAEAFHLDEKEQTTIANVSIHSDLIGKNCAFVAIPGLTLDGRNYLFNAIEKGCVAILAESEALTSTQKEQVQNAKVPVILVNKLAFQLANIASTIYPINSDKFNLIGITGTNGKSSICYLSAQIIDALTGQCGHMGTLGNGSFKKLAPALNTTSDLLTNYRTAYSIQNEGSQNLVMEVSSHALDQNRVEGLPINIAVFTNLTRDHLDYHKTFAAYGAAKKLLFLGKHLQYAIINADDEFGLELINEPKIKAKKIIYSVQDSIRSDDNSSQYVVAKNIQKFATHQEFDLISPWGSKKIQVPLIGTYNLSNVLAVISILGTLKFSLPKIVKCLKNIKSIPGRMELFSATNQPNVVVDYAHTPDALEKALSALREHTQGKLICVFGCGGDRDKGKRPLMGSIAESLSDILIITDDNPRFESSSAIIDDIKQGLTSPQNALIESNRQQAIVKAIKLGTSHDAILVAGKGHEDYQIIGAEKVSFSDRALVDSILREAA